MYTHWLSQTVGKLQVSENRPSISRTVVSGTFEFKASGEFEYVATEKDEPVRGLAKPLVTKAKAPKTKTKKKNPKKGT